jgi:hypothetical protein
MRMKGDLRPLAIAYAAGVPIETTYRREGDTIIVTWTTAVPVGIDYERGIVYVRAMGLDALRARPGVNDSRGLALLLEHFCREAREA